VCAVLCEVYGGDGVKPRDARMDLFFQAESLILQGQRPTAAVDEYCAATGCSRQAAYKLLKKRGLSLPRKPRSDKGASKVPDADAQAVAALQQRSRRKGKNKREFPMTAAKEYLLEDGAIAPASDSTYYRKLQALGLDRASRARPSPHVRLRSLCPNHMWQMDASQAAMWYLREGRLVLDSKRAMHEYKVEKKRNAILKRFIVADHFSTCRWVKYFYTSGEKAIHYVELFWEAMTYKGEHFPFCGIPHMVYTDPGPGLKSSKLQNVMSALGVHWQPHKPSDPQNREHARATGLIETLHGWWEATVENKWLATGRNFSSIDELNQVAYEECLKVNRKISRNLQTSPFEFFQRHVCPAAMEYPPEWDIVRRIAVGREETRTITGEWTIKYKARIYSLRALRAYPAVQPGKKVSFYQSSDPAKPDAIWIDTPDGRRHEVTPQELDVRKRPVSAPVPGEQYKAAPHDLATTARNRITDMPLPAGEAARQKVVSISGSRAVRKRPVNVPRLAWLELYGEAHDVSLAEAAAVYRERYGEALSAPEAEAGEGEAGCGL